MSAAPELIDVAVKKKSLKQALKNIATKLQENNSVVVDVDKRHQWMNFEEESMWELEKEKTIWRKSSSARNRPDFYQT